MLKPGDTIGILGGGQLGRMLAVAAARLGLAVHIYCDAADGPASEVARDATCAPYDDSAALAEFARACAVVTYEFENIPLEAVKSVSAITPVFPPLNALATAQDRIAEKAFLTGLAIPVAPYATITDNTDIEAARAAPSYPALLKTARFGYDGKGQIRVPAAEELETAWDAIDRVPAVLEQRIAFEREISVIAARGADGGLQTYDIAENVHADQILRTSTVPASISHDVAERAHAIARKILEALDYVGVIAIELFHATPGDRDALLVNEIAPRVHNSGHWTQDACAVSQFENHIRAIAGWPLADTARHADVVMTNLIGAEVEAWPEILGRDRARLHLYGKSQTRPGRKMGHVNTLSPHHS